MFTWVSRIGNEAGRRNKRELPARRSSLAIKLYPTWHGARKLIERIRTEKGVNILETDNRYHCAVKSGAGPNSSVKKYSAELVALLKLVQAGSPYTVTL
jgi:hypothetical protein